MSEELSVRTKDLHFLICEDYESIRTLIADDLRKSGVQSMTSAVSGNEAYKFIKRLVETTTPIGFVVTDLMMEDGSGIDLTKLIRSDPDPKIHKLPILMLTSKADVHNVLSGITAGVNNYVVKPWTSDDLNKRINEICMKLKI